MNTRHEQVAEIDPNDSIFADDFEIIVDSDPMRSLPPNAEMQTIVTTAATTPFLLDPSVNSMAFIHSPNLSYNSTVVNGTLGQGEPASPGPTDSNGSVSDEMYSKTKETFDLIRSTLVDIKEDMNNKKSIHNSISSLERELQSTKEELNVTRTELMEVRSSLSVLSSSSYSLLQPNNANNEVLLKKTTELNGGKTEVVGEDYKTLFFTAQDNITFLSAQLDETYAKYVNEHERRKLAEQQLENFSKSNAGSVHPPDLVNTQSLIDSLKSTEEKLAAALAENAKLLEAKKKYEEKTVDCDTTHEIISVLKEDQLEATRLLAEKEYAIAELQRVVDGLERCQVDNC